MTIPSPALPDGLPNPARPPLAARLPLLGLYPAKYRAAYGEEIAAVFAEATEDMSPGTALREWAHLAAHALRLRTRLSSTDPAGRIAAGAAPFLLAGGASLAMLFLLELLPPFAPKDWAHHPIKTTLAVARTGAWVLALLYASVGRWAPARLLVLLGVLARTGAVLAFTPEPQLAIGLPYLLLMPFGLVPGLLLLIAPPDAVDLSPRGRRETALTALILTVPLSVCTVLWCSSEMDERSVRILSPAVRNLLDASNVWPAAVLSAALLLHLSARRPDRLRAAGIAPAALCWTVMLTPPGFSGFAPPYHPFLLTAYQLLLNARTVLALLATATLLATLRHALHRARRTDPPEPA